MPEEQLLASIAQKLLVILSVSCLHRCQHWRNALPPLLLSAAPPGALCALFWPPAGMELHATHPTASGSDLMAGDSQGIPPHDQQDLWWRRCAYACMHACYLVLSV
jgi:hypothetical protein